MSVDQDLPYGAEPIRDRRRRCLDTLRHHPGIDALINADAQTA